MDRAARPSGRSATTARCPASVTPCTPTATRAPPSCCASPPRLAPPGADPVDELVALARDQLGEEPTLDLGLAALARRLGLPAGAAFGLFALGRSAGWIAHAIEARADDRLIRPRSRYTGPRPAAVGSSAP